MSEIQTAAVSRDDQFSTYADADPIKILNDVEDAIRSLDAECEEPLFCSADRQTGFVSSVSTSEIAAILAAPEPGAPKKRGRRPKPRPLGEMPVRKARAADPLWDGEEGQKRRRHIDPTTCERDYSEDEVEFMKALDLYKKLNGRLFPTCSETLEVIRRLGYVKMPPVHDSAGGEPSFAAPVPMPEIAGDVLFAAADWPPEEVFVVEA